MSYFRTPFSLRHASASDWEISSLRAEIQTP